MEYVTERILCITAESFLNIYTNMNYPNVVRSSSVATTRSEHMNLLSHLRNSESQQQSLESDFKNISDNSNCSGITMERNNNSSASVSTSSSYSDIFDALKKKISKLHSNFGQNFSSINNVFNMVQSFRRKSTGTAAVEGLSTDMLLVKESIEMSQLNLGEGKGHDFQTMQLSNPTWCDKCGDFIWGLSKNCLRCKYCQYTCHHHCKTTVTLDCAVVSEQAENQQSSDTFESKDITSCQETSVETTTNGCTESGYQSFTYSDIQNLESLTIVNELPRLPSQDTLTREDLQRRLDLFNSKCVGSNCTLAEDGKSFQGFLRVTLNLSRPITMSLSVNPPSIYEALTREHIVDQNTRSLSFYMPRDTFKSIHVTSTTSTKEVITSLLHKFRIIDHPRKFALYEQELQKKRIVNLRRVSNIECPLSVCLSWDLDNIDNYRLVLQENETGEIEWNAFSLPELQNFLRILDKEEQECVSQLVYKYKLMKRVMTRRCKEIRLYGSSEV